MGGRVVALVPLGIVVILSILLAKHFGLAVPIFLLLTQLSQLQQHYYLLRYKQAGISFNREDCNNNGSSRNCSHDEGQKEEFEQKTIHEAHSASQEKTFII